MRGHGAPLDASQGALSLSHQSPEPGVGRFFLGGIAGTAAITVMMYFVDPLITGRAVAITRISGKMLGDPHVVGGMALHIFKGAVPFPLAFAFLSVQLPGPGVVKGLIWGAILWLLAQGLLAPTLGCGFLDDRAGSVHAVTSLLAGYLVYGALQGLIAGRGITRA
jgi:hypothetical protein